MEVIDLWQDTANFPGKSWKPCAPSWQNGMSSLNAGAWSSICRVESPHPISLTSQTAFLMWSIPRPPVCPPMVPTAVTTGILPVFPTAKWSSVRCWALPPRSCSSAATRAWPWCMMRLVRWCCMGCGRVRSRGGRPLNENSSARCRGMTAISRLPSVTILRWSQWRWMKTVRTWTWLNDWQRLILRLKVSGVFRNIPIRTV